MTGRGAVTGPARALALAGLVTALALAGCNARPSAPVPRAAEPGVVIVESRQDLLDIAAANGVSAQALIAANGLSPPFDLPPGTRLVLPPPEFHVVRRGDSLSVIAARYGVSGDAVASLNGVRNQDRIFVGETLALPEGARRPGTTAALTVAGAGDGTGQDGSPGGTTGPITAPTPTPGANRVDVVELGELPGQTGTAPMAGDDHAVPGPPEPADSAAAPTPLPGEPAAADPTAIPETRRPEAVERDPGAEADTTAVAGLAAAPIEPPAPPDRPAAPAPTPEADAPRADAARTDPAPAENPSDAGERTAPTATGIWASPDTGMAVDPDEAPTANPPPDGEARAGLPATVEPPPLDGTGFRRPVSGEILSGFGTKPDGSRNDGINIAAPRGTPIVAAQSGVVAYAGDELRGFGNLVILRHEGDWVSAYAHTDRILVARGDRVTMGQTIATVGATGDVTTPQLHFELRRGRDAVDPSDHLDGS
ncbi:MAG: peptidoglycan DD-metalloendopeptidase family protein [Azospirillaceae bacterium]